MDKSLPLTLLPNYFRKIGFAYVILTILLIVCEEIFSIAVWKYISIDKQIFKTYTKYILVLAMYFIVMSKEKVEDEKAHSIRLNFMAKSFQMTCFLFIVNISVKAYDGSLFEKESPGREIFMLLGFYLGSFYWFKRKTGKAEKKSNKIEA